MSTSKQEIKVARKRATMGPSTIQVQSTPVGTRMSIGGPGMSVRRTTNVMRQSVGPTYMSAPGEATKISRNAVDTIVEHRDKEKHEMTELNARLAQHFEEKRFHQATIKALTDEIEKWKNLKGLDDKRLRAEFEDELEEARDANRSLTEIIAEKEAKILRLQDDLDTAADELSAMKRQHDDILAEAAKLTNMVGELEGELATTRRNADNAEREKQLLKDDIERLRNDNERVRNDCEDARCKMIKAANERDELKEMLEFDKDTYEIEIIELRELVKELQRITPNIQAKWSSDFKDMIRVIQEDYNQRMAIKEDECRRRYEDQLNTMQNTLLRDKPDVGPLKNENKTLKKQLEPLKDQCRKLEDELVMMQNAIPRDNTDHIQKSENKSLKSSLSKNKATISDLEREKESLRAQLEKLRRDYEEECENCEREKDELRAEIAGLSEQLQEIVDNMNLMTSKNLDLELEISCYRKLLEGEERQMAQNIENYTQIQSPGGAMLASAIAGGRGTGSGSGSSGAVQTSQSSNPQKDKPIKKPAGAGKEPAKSDVPVSTESTGTVRLKRTSRDTLIIREVEQSGGYVSIGTTGSKDCDISNFKLTRNYGLDKKQEASFTFPANTFLKKGVDIKVYASPYKELAGASDFVAKCHTWGSGNGKSELFDVKGASKAECVISYN